MRIRLAITRNLWPNHQPGQGGWLLNQNPLEYGSAEITMSLKISVAIPCYNGAAYVGQAIESMLAQTCPADEVLIVDDGSTDESIEIIRRYPVRLIQHEANLGLASARNTALNNSNEAILVFMDVDAMADASLLEVLLSGFDSPMVAGVGGRGIETNISTLADRWRREHATQAFGKNSIDVEHLFGLCMAYRSDVLRKIGGFNSEFLTNAEDVEVGLRLNDAGYRLRYLPDAIVYHRRTDDEMSLRKTMVSWHVAGYHARQLNKAHPWKIIVGILRRAFTDPLLDLITKRNIRMAQLSWKIRWDILRALRRVVAN